MSIKNRLLRILRGYLWKVLGFGYNHIQRSVDLPFLKNDTNATIGFGTYDNNALVYRWSDAPLVIGKYCSISYGVKFIMDDGSHLYNKISNYPFRANKVTSGGGIKIGNDVWICMDVIILNGVTIGDGAIIAAGSVVTNDVEPYTVVGGIPAKIIKEKCTREESKAMQNIAWWDWDKLEIENKRTDFQLSYNEFIIKYNKTKN